MAAALPEPLAGRLALARGPALITLVVTLARLGLELAQAPKWLASREAGGPLAVLGIAWLPLVFGPWFALRIGRALPTTGARAMRLVTTLAVYGWLARIPVVAVTFVNLATGWDTHYVKFGPPGTTPPSLQNRILLTLGFQLGVWVVWTILAGLIAGLVALAVARRPAAPAPA